MNTIPQSPVETIRDAAVIISQVACLASLVASIPEPDGEPQRTESGLVLVDWHVIKSNLELLTEKAYLALEKCMQAAECVENNNG
jgi:hypothetical protein